MGINYNNKKFQVVSNSENGEVSDELIFHYKQEGNIVSCNYSGKNIQTGHLLGIVDELGKIEMRYHQVNQKGELLTGVCSSHPKVLENGKIRLNESWQWTCGDNSKGTSILEEI